MPLLNAIVRREELRQQKKPDWMSVSDRELRRTTSAGMLLPVPLGVPAAGNRASRANKATYGDRS